MSPNPPARPIPPGLSPLEALAAALTEDGGALRDALPFTLTGADIRPRPDPPQQAALFERGACDMTVKIIANEKGNPPGKLAEAELHFTHGPLAGLKLIGFSVWERKSGTGRNVTFPARQYAVNGERRSFALLRPGFDLTAPGAGLDAQNRVRDLILDAYAAFEQAAAEAV